MAKKLRQVTDNIHGTIYLSELESELISTPYFYRLHDIYQSSTVYMTFPSNRTKRYEHSLGTMAIAAKTLYSAVTNADLSTRNRLFEILKREFLDISELVIGSDNSEHLYFSENKEEINKLFDSLKASEMTSDDFFKSILNLMDESTFFDNALAFYQYYPMVEKSSKNKSQAVKESIINVFLYRCLLQAIRIVALFHDVGHPPYSHIIEKVLRNLYIQISLDSTHKWNQGKVKQFKKCLDPFFSKEPTKAYKCSCLYSTSSLINAESHERIGLGLLNYAIKDVISTEISSIAKKYEKKPNLAFALILYYITVTEFAFAILTEKSSFFKSFHKIVDGPLDADRLDYIVRDSQNSGVDWGKIPYERIINSAKLFKLEKDDEIKAENEEAFVVAYPQKVADDIEDLLLVRYKIFARINFHHRCMRTAAILQEAVKELAIDFLSSPNSNPSKRKKDPSINPDIQILWTALDSGVGTKTSRIIQWNDSWLISTLHKALISLNTQKGKNEKLRENLEELLLNKKKYYSLLKRGSDNRNFAESVLRSARIAPASLTKLLLAERQKVRSAQNANVSMEDIMEDPRSRALDSIGRLRGITDIEALFRFIPLPDKGLETTLTSALEASNDVSNYAIIINEDRGKDGLPKHNNVFEAIYLYDGDQYSLFDETQTLRDQISAIAKNTPWLYIYFVPSDDDADINRISEKLLNDLTIAVGSQLQKRYNELFIDSPSNGTNSHVCDENS